MTKVRKRQKKWGFLKRKIRNILIKSQEKVWKFFSAWYVATLNPNINSKPKTLKSHLPTGETRLMSMEAQRSVGKLAIKCLCDVYKSTTYFNFHNNVTMLLVHCAHGDKDESVREECCQAIKTLFRSDKKGESWFQKKVIFSLSIL